jgi:hypothetical protein
MFSVGGVCVGDLLVSIDGIGIDNYGEMWMERLGVSLGLIDVLSRKTEDVKLNVISKTGVLCEKIISVNNNNYQKNPIRLLDTVLDAELHKKEMMSIRGVRVKTLRLDDVMNYKIQKYLHEDTHHHFRIVVFDIESHSPAFQAKSIRPGSIIKLIDNKPVPNNWKDFTLLMQTFEQQQPIHITTEDNTIIIV